MIGRIGGWPLWGFLLLAISSGCCCIDGGTMVGCDMVGDSCGGGIITGGCDSCTGGCGGGCGSGYGADFGCGGPLFGRPLFYGPLFGGYFAGHCGGGDVGCNGYASYADDSCGGGCGNGCGTCGGGCGNPYGYGPVIGVLGLLRHALVCGFGCGPVYWDEWASDPPLCHDPCGSGDCVGNCSYGGCSTCGGGSDGGCSTCGSGENYLSEPQGDYVQPSSSCPDGSCGAHRAMPGHLVPAAGEVLLGEAPAAPATRQMMPSSPQGMRRVSHPMPQGPTTSHRVATQPMRTSRSGMAPSRTVTSRPMMTQPMYR